MKYNFRTVTANTSATIDDHVIGVDTSSISIRVQLPSAASVRRGFLLTIKDIAGGASVNNITIVRGNSDTIDGATTITQNSNYGTVRLFSNGNHTWHVY